MDIVILLTGDKDSGRQTVADIAVQKFNCTGSVSLDYWCEEVIRKEFKISIEEILLNEPFDKPIIIKRAKMGNLMAHIAEAGFNNVYSISTGRWWGREIKTPQELLLWFRDEVVGLHCGIDFLVKIAKERYIDKWQARKVDAHNVFFITNFKGPVTAATLKALKPAMVFQAIVSRTPKEAPLLVLNDGTLEDLETKVKSMLSAVRKQVKALIPTNEPKKARK